MRPSALLIAAHGSGLQLYWFNFGLGCSSCIGGQNTKKDWAAGVLCVSVRLSRVVIRPHQRPQPDRMSSHESCALVLGCTAAAAAWRLLMHQRLHAENCRATNAVVTAVDPSNRCHGQWTGQQNEVLYARNACINDGQYNYVTSRACRDAMLLGQWYDNAALYSRFPSCGGMLSLAICILYFLRLWRRQHALMHVLRAGHCPTCKPQDTHYI